MKPTATRASFDAPLAAWFATQGWKPAPFQREAWRRRVGLILDRLS